LFSGCVQDVPEYPYDQNYDQFAFHSLLTRKESIEATGKVRTECNKVCIMSLFHIPTTKPMRLEEFEQTQSQASSQVSYMFFGINFIFICNLDFFPLISQE
jgi:dynein heavy chain